jgi:hypothetical protein
MNGLFFRGDMPGFRFEPEEETPGFRVTSQVVPPGFNLDENGIPRQEPSWPNGTQPGPTAQYPDLGQTLAAQARRLPMPGTGDLIRPTPPKFPDWLYKLVTMPLPQAATVSDPRTGRRIVPYEPLVNLVGGPGSIPVSVLRTPSTKLASVRAPGTQQWASFDTPGRLADVTARSGAGTAQRANPRPVAQEATWSTSPDPLESGRRYAQAGGIQSAGFLPTSSAWPAADSNFVLGNIGNDGVQRPQQPPFRQEQPPTPRIGAPVIEPSIYRPGSDARNEHLFELVQGVRENKIQGDAAEDAEAAAAKRTHPEVKIAQQIRIYAAGAPDYMVADIVFRSNGTADIVILEIKSGDGILTPKQLAKLAEAARTGNIYIVNEKAAKSLHIEPRVTFASQGILPQVYVVGGNHDAIARQLRNLGLEVVPERAGRGRPPRYRIGVPPI